MILIVTEKPKAAERIAKALNCNYRKKMFGINYYMNRDIIVTSAIGHLYELTTNDRGVPVLNYEWVEAYNIKGKDYTKRYIDLIKYLSYKADELMIATDYDIEGELLGFNIYRFICKHLPVSRMKFSSLTKSEIINAFRRPIEINKNLVDSGEARHVLDFLWGLNVSRCLMLAFNNELTLSAGRVQSPALHLIFEREEEIRNFKPKTFYIIKLIATDGLKEYEFEYYKKVENPFELSNIISLRPRILRVNLIERKIISYKIAPFNLSDLQQEAYALYKLSPKKTLEIAEELYLKSLISYPRTDSQKFPKGLNFRYIIQMLSKIPIYENYCKKLLSMKVLIPKEGKKTDDAHPCIYPTGEIPTRLTKKEALVYDLIVRRFLACFYDDLKVLHNRAWIIINDHKFKLEWNRILNKGWLEVYYFKTIDEKNINLRENCILYFKRFHVKKERTKPPSRYTRASLVKKLESLGLGTKSTRAEIVEKLFLRKYVEGEPMRITDIGIRIINILKKYVPEICSVELTRRFEEKLNLIEKGILKKEDVINEAKNEIVKIVRKFLDNIDEIRRDIHETNHRKL